jgi:hypothetical protein
MRDSIDGCFFVEEKGLNIFGFQRIKKSMTDAKLMSEMD